MNKDRWRDVRDVTAVLLTLAYLGCVVVAGLTHGAR